MVLVSLVLFFFLFNEEKTSVIKLSFQRERPEQQQTHQPHVAGRLKSDKTLFPTVFAALQYFCAWGSPEYPPGWRPSAPQLFAQKTCNDPLTVLLFSSTLESREFSTNSLHAATWRESRLWGFDTTIFAGSFTKDPVGSTISPTSLSSSATTSLGEGRVSYMCSLGFYPRYLSERFPLFFLCPCHAHTYAYVSLAPITKDDQRNHFKLWFVAGISIEQQAEESPFTPSSNGLASQTSS